MKLKTVIHFTFGETLCVLVVIGIILASFSPLNSTAYAASESFHNNKKHITIYGASPFPVDHVAENYDLVITEWWRKKEIEALKKIKPSIIILFYRNANGVLHDYDDWKVIDKNASWFVKDDRNNSRIKSRRHHWFLMDVGNNEYRKHVGKYLADKLTSNPHLDGVFLDDVYDEINPAAFVLHDNPRDKFTASAAYLLSYQESMSKFLREIKQYIGDRKLFINTGNGAEYLRHADGVMFEGFVHAAWEKSDYDRNLSEWFNDITRLQRLIKTGKTVLVHSGTENRGESVYRQFLFCYASYLLFSTEDTYFYFDLGNPKGMPQFYEYFIKLEKPGRSVSSEEVHLTHDALFRSLDELKDWKSFRGDSSTTHSNTTDPEIFGFSSEGLGDTITNKFELQGNMSVLKIKCSVKAQNVIAGKEKWQRFALLGKYLGNKNEIVQGGIDLAFDLGSYDWVSYEIEYPIPPGVKFLGVNALGFYRGSTGRGWIKDLRIDAYGIDGRLQREYGNYVVFVNPGTSPADIHIQDGAKVRSTSIQARSGVLVKIKPAVK